MKTKKITNFIVLRSQTALFLLTIALLLPLSNLNAQKINKKIDNSGKKATLKPAKVVSKPTDSKTKPIKAGKALEKPVLKDLSLTKKDTITVGTGNDAISVPVEPVVQELPKGKVDWTNQYIEAKGESVIDNERFKNAAQAKLMAKRGAIVVAQRNLLEITKGVQVTSETKVQDMITTSDYVYSRVDGVIKNAVQIGEAVEKEGYIEVTMRIPLYEKNGLAPAIYDQVAKTTDAKKTTMNTVKQITSLPETTTADGTGTTADTASTTEITDLSKLAFNLNGKTYDPSMFPVVMDEKGNVVLDYSKIYDPKTGKFPKIVSAGKSLLEAFGAKKGVEVLDVIGSADGKITVDTSKVKNKINWTKIGSIASTIGKFALALVL